MKYPYMLLLSVFPAAYLLNELLKTGSKAEAFYSFSVYSDKTKAAKAFIFRHIYLVLMNFTGMVMFVIALACPFYQSPAPAGRIDAFTSDTVFVFDISQSMLCDDNGKSRLEKSIESAAGIINSTAGRFGIVIFKGSAFTFLPLTENKEIVSDSILKLDTDLFTSSGTDIGEGLLHGIRLFPDFENTVKKLVLFTDGEEPVPGSMNSRSRVQEIRENLYSKGISMLILIPDNFSGSEVPGVKDQAGEVVFSVPDAENIEMIRRITDSIVLPFSRFSSGSFTSFRLERSENISLSNFYSAAGLLFFAASLFVKGKRWQVIC